MYCLVVGFFLFLRKNVILFRSIQSNLVCIQINRIVNDHKYIFMSKFFVYSSLDERVFSPALSNFAHFTNDKPFKLMHIK